MMAVNICGSTSKDHAEKKGGEYKNGDVLPIFFFGSDLKGQGLMI